MNMANVRLGYSPLSETIYIYRHGKKDINLALDKRDATGEVMRAVIQLIGEGHKLEFQLGDRQYIISVQRRDRPAKKKVKGK